MYCHTYTNLRYAILHSVDYRCANGHLLHDRFETIYYEDLVWC
jgi:hypothetical protein